MGKNKVEGFIGFIFAFGWAMLITILVFISDKCNNVESFWMGICVSILALIGLFFLNEALSD